MNTPPIDPAQRALPFEPESMEDMQRRWPAVLLCRFEAACVEDGRQMNPCFLRAHVFDFFDGIRMLAAVEDISMEVERFELHLSFGIHSDHHRDWIVRGHAAYTHRVEQIVVMLQVLVILGELSSHEETPRAHHYWFKNPKHPYLKS